MNLLIRHIMGMRVEHRILVSECLSITGTCLRRFPLKLDISVTINARTRKYLLLSLIVNNYDHGT